MTDRLDEIAGETARDVWSDVTEALRSDIVPPIEPVRDRIRAALDRAVEAERAEAMEVMAALRQELDAARERIDERLQRASVFDDMVRAHPDLAREGPDHWPGYYADWQEVIDAVPEDIRGKGYSQSPLELICDLTDDRDEWKQRATRAEAEATAEKLSAAEQRESDLRWRLSGLLDNLTNATLSKTNYDLDTMLAAVHECQCRMRDEAVSEATEEAEQRADRAEAEAARLRRASQAMLDGVYRNARLGLPMILGVETTNLQAALSPDTAPAGGEAAR